MENDINYSNYVVAFIDVLGQKKAFEGIDVLTQDSMDISFEKKLIEAHKATAHFLDKFRGWFDEYFEAFKSAGGKSIDRIPLEKRELYLELSECTLEHQRFSDSEIAFTSLEITKHHLPAMNALFGMMAACGSLLLLSLSVKKVFRAGIDLGIGTRLDSGELYGPALFKAYYLESEIAEYPRIVIGETVINYLMNLSRKNTQSQKQVQEDIDLCKVGADNCLSMIEKDDDSRYILDYLGKSFRKFEDNLSEKTEYDTLYKNAFSFVCAEYEKYKAEKDERLSVRYERLYNYFKRKGFK